MISGMTISASVATKLLSAIKRKIRFNVKRLNVAGDQVIYLSGSDHVLFTLIVETVKQWSITDQCGWTMLRKRKSL